MKEVRVLRGAILLRRILILAVYSKNAEESQGK
jgi:hypothetical protein